jgi:hypothetical protein
MSRVACTSKSSGDDNFSFETMKNLMAFYGASSLLSTSCTLPSVSTEFGTAL